MHKKWLQIQSILQKRLSPGQYKVWISSLVPSWEKRGLVLFAQSEFAVEFIRNKFMPFLDEAAAEVVGHGCPVFVEYRPSLFAQGAGKAKEASKLLPRQGKTRNPAAHAGQAVGGTLTPALTAKKDVTRPAGEDRLTRGRKALALCLDENARPPLRDARSVYSPATADCDSSKLYNGAGGALAMPSPLNVPNHSIQNKKHPSGSSILPSPRPLPFSQLALPVTLEAKPNLRQERSWRFSFENFIVGPCNELAYAASRSICDEMLHTDILYLSSAPGLGKTHLMQAVGKVLETCCNHTRARVEYLTAEEFASQFYYALNKLKSTDDFKARFRSADLLLLEDVHFLQGKEKLQQELLATIKTLREKGSKVVFTSSFAPRDLKLLDEQLQSRLCAGLLAVIEKPDEATRRKILRHKAHQHQTVLPRDVEDVLAQHIHADVRQIESCLHNLILKARLLNSGITLQMAFDVLSQYAVHNPVLDMEAIVACVCRGFGLNREQLASASRKKEYVAARNTAFYLARKHTDLSLEAIGRRFNRRHSTVLKGITNLEREMNRESPVGRQLSNVLSMIERTGNILRVNA